MAPQKGLTLLNLKAVRFLNCTATSHIFITKKNMRIFLPVHTDPLHKEPKPDIYWILFCSHASTFPTFPSTYIHTLRTDFTLYHAGKEMKKQIHTRKPDKEESSSASRQHNVPFWTVLEQCVHCPAINLTSTALSSLSLYCSNL